jgi:molecular chaperone HscB
MESARDPFALLGLPRTFDLDAAEIDAAYLQRAAELHPDRLAAARGGGTGAGTGHLDPLAEADAARRAAELNDARAELGNPERRAGVLLHLLGGPRPDEDRSLPDGFLLEMMDVRQELDAAQAAQDAAELERLRAWAASRRAAHMMSLSSKFRRLGDLESGSPERGRAAMAPSLGAGEDLLRDIRRELNAWRYIERMIDQSGE